MAAPPTHDPSAFVTTTENTLARLRKTERQFRESSILAALDVEARQLFTFYKKVDITHPKDQKTLLLKFGFVLRSNTCTIAYKTAARLPDLMKPEQARLYRLFITAIVFSVKLSPSGDTTLQIIGPNLYLVASEPTDTERDFLTRHRKWILNRIDLQVVPSGHLILTVVKDDALSFSSIQDSFAILNDPERNLDSIAVYLAPIGCVGRLLQPGQYSSASIEDYQNEAKSSKGRALDARREMWKGLLPVWLKEYMSTSVQAQGIPWIEIEVPLEEADCLTGESQDDSTEFANRVEDAISWKLIFWPANLCFLFNGHESTSKTAAQDDLDPMQFVRDWILGTGPAASKTETGRQTAIEDDDEPLFADNGTFDDPGHFQTFGPPAFPANQMIYPTPPDVGMTHYTPGLSSLDGIAMTPANLLSSSAEFVQQQDEDMADFEEVPPASGLSGYYDEDLFEDMPDDTFEQETNGDEPNWDFFDGPGAKRKVSRSASHNRRDGTANRGEPKQVNVEDSNTLAVPSIPLDRLAAVKRQTSTAEVASIPTVSAPPQSDPQTTAAPEILKQEQKQTFSSPPKPAPPLWHNDDVESTAPTIGLPRRSSIFDGPKPVSSIPEHDSKYDADGDYWFDPAPVPPQLKLQPKPIHAYARPPSSPSDSDSSMNSSSQSPRPSSRGYTAPPLFRQWTKYDAGSQDGGGQPTETDQKAIEQDVYQILGLLKPGLVDPPAALDFQLDVRRSPRSPLMTSQKMQYIAQILVDQMTQTSLLSREEQHGDIRTCSQDQGEMNLDLSGINTYASASTLSQLVNLKAENSSNRLQGRVSRLRASQICVKRIERPLTASLSILNFWDTLNLQPEHGPKDVTALCIHPFPEHVREGCLNLLQRLSDSYTTCALGTHIVGKLPGVTEDGLIPWRSDSPGQRNLLQATTTVGRTLAMTLGITGTVVVYMVSRGESPSSYLEMCIAFYDLFESFTKTRRDSEGVSDMQLQIIPQDFVANSNTLVIPPQTAYTKLAIEVYNRLPPVDLDGPPGACGSAMILSRSENSVRLQLKPAYGPPLEKNGPCLHLSYSVSHDKRWIVAVWTDELGHVALSMSYCSHLRQGSRGRPRREIFKEMWGVSQDLMSKVRGAWRLAVVRFGFYDPSELLEWHQIFDGSPASQKRCVLLLLSVRSPPDWTLLPPPAQGKSGPAGGHNLYGTPASTPQASMTSPDQIVPATPTPGGSTFMNAPTPPDPSFDHNAESDLTVIDPSEDSWGIVLPFGMNQSRNMTELRPSQVTGFLMKRQGPKGNDGYHTIEFSLVKTIVVASNKVSDLVPDESLEDLIRQYRGLITLGATRGCVDPNGDGLPWHIATAMRGVHVLEQAT